MSNLRVPESIAVASGVLPFRCVEAFYGDSFKVECPTGSGVQMTLYEVGIEIGERLTRIFLPDASGRRPVYGSAEKFQTDPHWNDYVLFYEYFHGDNGAGIGASHQTGWTGCIARIIQVMGDVTSEMMTRKDVELEAIKKTVGKSSKPRKPGRKIRSATRSTPGPGSTRSGRGGTSRSPWAPFRSRNGTPLPPSVLTRSG